jgi:ketosteroid isomerase-like protein
MAVKFVLVLPPGSTSTGGARFYPESMPSLTAELTAFIRQYELANTSHDFARLAPLICDDATYWFSEGSYHGIEEIRKAIERSFATIQEEVYQIHELTWVAMSDDLAVCTYGFSWQGLVDGRPASGSGRGTNVVTRRDGVWKMLHEHLSS